MADLEDFLRQAAERRKARANQAKPTPPQSTRPVRQRERVAEPEIIEPEIIESGFSNPDSGNMNRPKWRSSPSEDEDIVGASVDHADERMIEHLRGVFDQSPNSFDAPRRSTGRLADSVDAISDDSAKAGASKGDEVVDRVLELMKKPESLQTAFVLSEIFRRKQF
jgi:hypothetical protein